MDNVSPTATADRPGAEFALTEHQRRFFECFGFLRLPAVFSQEEMREIGEGFEEVFSGYDDPNRKDVMRIKEGILHMNDRFHEDPRRYIIPNFIARSPRMSWLQEDPRVCRIVETLIGSEYESTTSDGSLFFCETSWHPDFYQSKMEQFNIKLSLYLEPLRADSGAIRFLPGSHFYQSSYARKLRETLYQEAQRIRENFGIEPDAIPSYPVETDPGDLVVWNFRVIHASFYGAPRRRLISLNFREPSKATAES